MSGGSYDYLCYAEIDGICQRSDHLARMHARLVELGYHEAAAATSFVQAAIAGLASRIDTTGLRHVWKAVEWFDSCDWSREDADAAHARFVGVDTPGE